MSKRKSSNRKTGAIIGLCVLLVLTIVFGYLGFNGMPLDGRGLYKLLPWMPTTWAWISAEACMLNILPSSPRTSKETLMHSWTAPSQLSSSV